LAPFGFDHLRFRRRRLGQRVLGRVGRRRLAERIVDRSVLDGCPHLPERFLRGRLCPGSFRPSHAPFLDPRLLDPRLLDPRLLDPRLLDPRLLDRPLVASGRPAQSVALIPVVDKYVGGDIGLRQIGDFSAHPTEIGTMRGIPKHRVPESFRVARQHVEPARGTVRPQPRRGGRTR
jgi:hypothetical protein